jgi:hypothetical protein
MKTHKKKQVKKQIYIKKTKKGGFKGPLDYAGKHLSRMGQSIKKSASDYVDITKQKTDERGARRMKYVRGQLGDLAGSIGHSIKNMENPIVFAYQLIEDKVFGWGVTKQEKPAFNPKHKSVSFKDFLKSDIPEFKQRNLIKAKENKQKEDKKKLIEDKKKLMEDKKKLLLQNYNKMKPESKKKLYEESSDPEKKKLYQGLYKAKPEEQRKILEEHLTR